MEAQQVVALAVLQEETAFDELGRQVGQRHGVKTSLARQVFARRRHIEYGKQTAFGIEHRARRTGQCCVPATEVLVTRNGQRLALQQAQADAIGALGRLVPHRPEPEPGALEFRALGLIRHAVDHHAAGVGQQYRVAAAAQLLVQAVHLPVGDGDNSVQPLAMLIEPRTLDHAGRARAGGVELMLLQATAPGTRNGGIGSRALAGGRAVTEAQDLVRVLTEARGHSCCSPRCFEAVSRPA